MNELVVDIVYNNNSFNNRGWGGVWVSFFFCFVFYVIYSKRGEKNIFNKRKNE